MGYWPKRDLLATFCVGGGVVPAEDAKEVPPVGLLVDGEPVGV